MIADEGVPLTTGASAPPLVVATCQFPVSADPGLNGRFVMRQMRYAHEQGAQVAHFPEACLSGYAGCDLDTYEGFDWQLLDRTKQRVQQLAGELGVWVVVGSAHRLTGDHKPHNSLYIIDAAGDLVDRYDKRFCSGDPAEQTGDLLHFSPGNHLSVFAINGVHCGALICYDVRFPELYREYKRHGVQLMFHSYHAAHLPPERIAANRAAVGDDLLRLNPGGTYPGITMPASMTAAAAANHMWISCPNSSARESCWGSFFVRADAVTTGRLARHRTGVLLSTVDTSAALYDSTAAWRGRALAGVLHSGMLVDDPRSDDRTHL
ncbi:MAG TPA: carbon-nitrogen hydrolase family protein [Kineosporiaceae bacterium]|nr:carbon-nitrogen hydrolase family protein [Kineosporiaceae bacterium]